MTRGVESVKCYFKGAPLGKVALGATRHFLTELYLVQFRRKYFTLEAMGLVTETLEECLRNVKDCHKGFNRKPTVDGLYLDPHVTVETHNSMMNSIMDWLCNKQECTVGFEIVDGY